jgi:ribose transport system permease protein
MTTVDEALGSNRTTELRRPWTGYLSAASPLAAVVAVAILFSVITPESFLTAGNLRTVLDQAALPLILAMGATFVILLGAIDLSVEGVMATSALTFVLLSNNNVNSLDLGIAAPVIAVAAGCLLGALTGMIHTRFKVPSFMVSLGVWYIGLGIATVLFGNQVPQLTDSADRDWASAAPLGISNAFVLALVVVALAAAASRWTRFGRYAFAIGADEDIARISSVPVNRYKIYIFAAAAICSGLAGVVGSARLGVGIVDVGSGQLFTTIAAVVVGGTLLSGGQGGIFRSFCGVLLLTVINNGLILTGVSPNIQQAVSGLVIVLAVVVTGLRSRSRLRVVK